MPTPLNSPPSLPRNKRAWPEPARHVPPWTPEEAQHLYRFLHSDVGRRVALMLQLAIAGEMAKAMTARGTEDGAWQRGFARGMESAMGILNALSHVDEDPPGDKDDRPADDLSWLDPTRGPQDDDTDYKQEQPTLAP